MPQIRCILAPNPSPMTLHGTNSYLIGTGDVALIDPGPNLPAHANAIMAALQPGERITHIFVTHAHLDHSPLAPIMAQALNIKTHAFGPATAGRSPAMTALANQGLIAGGEGIDHAFTPDIPLAHDETLTHNDWSLRAIHTPGHLSNHLCFAQDQTLFTGDHIMGWSSSLISPPDGDMAAYMAATRHLSTQKWTLFHAGHGAPITDPHTRLTLTLHHRMQREASILHALTSGPKTIPQLTAQLYTDTPQILHAAAARSILAHLIDLTTQIRITARPTLGPHATYRLA
jgi:glyoxylase-like metal-dependent hydrolase (beta-lactamase superfamily II)